MKRKPNTGPTLSSSLKRLRGYCAKIQRETKKLPLNLDGNGGKRTKLEIGRDSELVRRTIQSIRKAPYYSSMVEKQIDKILTQRYLFVLKSFNTNQRRS